jgi:plastocyanin
MSRSRRSTPLALLAIAALVLAACAETTGSPAATPTPSRPEATASPTVGEGPEATASGAAAEQVTVRMDGSDFLPAELAIAVGTKVTFVNVSEFEHTVTEGSGGRAVEDPFVDEEVAEGDSEDVTFDEPGTYEITCRIHPTMELTVTVEG